MVTAYADRIVDELRGKPLNRALLAAFAEEAGWGTRVLDVGCGPGHLRAHPASRFVVGSMPEPGNVHTEPWQGAAAFYALTHLDRPGRRKGLRRLRDVVAIGAPLLIAVHEGDEVRHLAEWWGHGIELDFHFIHLDFHFIDADELRADVSGAGSRVKGVLTRAPYPGEADTARLYVVARSTPRARRSTQPRLRQRPWGPDTCGQSAPPALGWRRPTYVPPRAPYPS